MTQAPDRGVSEVLTGLGVAGIGAVLALRVLGGGAQAAMTEPSVNLVRTALTAAALGLIAAGSALGGHGLAVPRRGVLAGLVVWTGANALSLTGAVDLEHGWLRLAEVADDGLLLLALWAIAARGPRARAGLVALALAFGVTVGGLAIKERVWDRPEARASYDADPGIAAIDPELRADFESRLYADQASGPFVIPNGLGAFGAACALLALGGLLAARTTGGRALMVVAVAGGVAAVALAAQKGPPFAFVAGAIAAAAFAYRARWPRGAQMAIGAVIAAALALHAVIAFVPGQRLERLPGGVSLAVRHDYDQAALAMVERAPLRGVGAANFAVHYPALKPAGAEETRLCHNDWLEALAESGPLGLLGLAGLWTALLVGAWRGARAPGRPGRDDAAHAALVAGGAVGSLALIAFGLPYRNPPTAIALAAAVPALAWLGERALRDAPPRWLVAGAVGAVFAFCVQAGLDFSHREPGIVGLALLLAVVGQGRGAETTRHRASAAIVAAVAFALMLPLALRWLPQRIALDQAMLEADAAVKRGDLRAADVALTRAGELDPDARGPLVRLADLAAIAWTGTADPRALDKAVRRYKRATAGRPDLSLPKRRAGDLLLGGGRAGEAARWLEQAVAADPGHPGHHLALAEALTASGDPARAATEAARALELDPRQRQVRNRLTPDQRRRAVALQAR